MIIMLIVQASQIMIANIVVQYSAFAAVRSASVWIPASLEHEYENEISSFSEIERDGEVVRYRIDADPSSPKFNKIQRAAVMNLFSLGPSRDLGYQTLGQYMSSNDALISLYQGLDTESTSNGLFRNRIRNKLAYSIDNLFVDLTFWHRRNHHYRYKEPPLQVQYDVGVEGEFYSMNELGWQDHVTAEVTYQLPLLPGPVRFFAPLVRDESGSAPQTDRTGEVYIWTLSAQATMGIEGQIPFYVYRQESGQMKLSQQMIQRVRRLPADLHQNQNASISVACVFCFIFLTMVLGMVINMGRHFNRKVKLQNSADAVTYTGTAVCARSMNTLAFTNHLLCDVFALTAYLGEARDRSAEALAPSVLAAWTEVAPEFGHAPEQNISQLMFATPQKVQLEQQMITVFGQHNAAISEQLLPVMESVLAEEMIPNFQRALAQATPSLANQAAHEIASRHGPQGRGLNPEREMAGLMWRTDARPFDSKTLDGLSQLPVSDPIFAPTAYAQDCFNNATQQRRVLTSYYLRRLNETMLEKFDAIRRDPLQETNTNSFIAKDYTFVGVAYWKAMDEHMPGLFRNPLDSDSVAFAQSQLYTPKERSMRIYFRGSIGTGGLNDIASTDFFLGVARSIEIC